MKQILHVSLFVLVHVFLFVLDILAAKATHDERGCDILVRFNDRTNQRVTSGQSFFVG